eukprot:COSAG05_NODE_22741_length_262_cov_2.055215_1_plen_68_part_01
MEGCNTFIDAQKRRTPALAVHFGPADAMLSHSWENSLVSLDRAVQQHVEKKGLVRLIQGKFSVQCIGP